MEKKAEFWVRREVGIEKWWLVEVVIIVVVVRRAL